MLDSLYGYKEDSTGKLVYTGPLADNAVPHIMQLFNHITSVPEQDYYNKIISTSIGGHWESDGVNYFLEGLIEHVLKNPTLTFKLLENRTEAGVKGFWFFFFDGPHPDKNIPTELKKMKTVSPRVYTLMNLMHKKVLEKVDH